MSFLVIQFEEDGKVSAVPTSWFNGRSVVLPPLFGKNMTTAIRESFTPDNSWEEYAAICVWREGPYDIAVAYEKKFSSNNEDSDTSPCRGLVRRRRPRPIRRYTPDPTDEDAPIKEQYITPPVLHSTVISPVSGTSSAAGVKYPVMQATTLPVGADTSLNLSIPGNAVASQSSLQHKTGNEDVMGAIDSLKSHVDNSLAALIKAVNDVASKVQNIDLHLVAVDEQINKYHADVLRTAGTSSPIPPRWQPWFPLRSVEELEAMELNLRNENCRADVITFIQRTPSNNIEERTKCCLGRMLSEQLSILLSWQRTPNKMAFGNTALWAVVFETLAATSSDPVGCSVGIRRVCIGWFHNARDRSGGRSKRRYTCPKMPLIQSDNQNIPPALDPENTSA